MATRESTDPANARLSLGERVTRDLRDKIISGEYAPGQRLVEARLSADFGVSRVPVREALRTLESEGFITSTSYTERVVAQLSLYDLYDLYDLREAVEHLTVGRAAQRADPAGRKALIALLSEGMHHVAENDVSGVSDLNARFHQAIALASGSDMLRGIFSQLESKIRWSTHLWDDARWRESWQEHAAIVQAIIMGDAGEAQRLMGAHLQELRSQARHDDPHTSAGETPT
jgi:DNA-binding GntR family transcriptional regulator